jgi:ketosteroid isomerase-like protein
MKTDHNPFTDALRRILRAHTGPDASQPLANLPHAFREIPVMAIRKYAFEHAFAWLLEDQGKQAEGAPWFEAVCEDIERLVKTYTQIQFRALKLVMSGDSALLASVEQLLDEQDEREFAIKTRLLGLFDDWQRYRNIGVPRPDTEQAPLEVL